MEVDVVDEEEGNASESRTKRVIQRGPRDWIHLPPWFKGDKTASERWSRSH